MSLFDEWESSKSKPVTSSNASSTNINNSNNNSYNSNRFQTGRPHSQHNLDSDEDEEYDSALSARSLQQRMQMPAVRNTNNNNMVGANNILYTGDNSNATVVSNPMFSMVPLSFHPSGPLSSIQDVTVGSSVLIMGFNGVCHIIRMLPDSMEMSQITLSRRADDIIYKTFISPNGHHALVSLTNGQVYYINSKWTKGHLLTKVKNIIIESVGWNSTGAANEKSTNKILIGTNRGQIYETFIEEKDKYFKKLYDLVDNSATTNNPNNNNLNTMGVINGNNMNSICGLHLELFPGLTDGDAPNAKWFILAVTATRLYQFIGGPTFEILFSRYSTPNFLELPGSLNISQLRLYSKYQAISNANKSATPELCAWMTEAGIYWGTLVFGSQELPGDHVLEEGKLLAYPEFPNPANADGKPGASRTSTPIAIALTEFHFLMLFNDRLIAVNRLSELVAYEQVFNAAFTTKNGKSLGLAPDPRTDTVWMYCEKSVFEIVIEREDRDVWRLYLAQRNFDEALEYTDTDAQKEIVLNAQADHSFEAGAFHVAAKIYAKTNRSFEEVALKLLNQTKGSTTGTSTSTTNKPNNTNSSAISVSSLNSQNALSVASLERRAALKTYLLAKLEALKAEDMTQQTMLCTWLTEIYLHNINSLQEPETIATYAPTTSPNAVVSTFPPYAIELGLSTYTLAGNNSSVNNNNNPPVDLESLKARRESELDEFRNFISDYFDCLNKATTMELIASHGLIDELLFYANIIGDLEWLLQHHIQRKQYDKALAVLSKVKEPSKVADLFYKYTPTLIHAIPTQTVDMLCKIPVSINAGGLDPSKLIPALMRHNSTNNSDASRSDADNANAIRYLEHCVLNRNRDPTIHNYLVSLYAASTSPSSDRALLKFLDNSIASNTSGNNSGIDYRYALRVCHAANKKAACVKLYMAMELYEEAVQLALELDINLAKQVLGQVVNSGNTSSNTNLIKKLWILIARHVISTANDISITMALLKEASDSGCLLSLDELLPFFPDFVRIGDFKEEICKSLDAYNANIEQLKSTMNDYTATADLIRNDIAQLRNRSGVITSTARCDYCSRHLLSRPFSLFPCTHCFHTDCLNYNAKIYLDRHPQIKNALWAHLSDKDKDKSSGNESEVRGIEQFASRECPFCGEMMIDSVHEPFISPNETDELKAWEI